MLLPAHEDAGHRLCLLQVSETKVWHHWTIYPSIFEKELSNYLSIHLSIHLSIYPSIHLSIHLSIYPSIHPSIFPSLLSVNLSICPSLCIFVSILGQMMPCLIENINIGQENIPWTIQKHHLHLRGSPRSDIFEDQGPWPIAAWPAAWRRRTPSGAPCGRVKRKGFPPSKTWKSVGEQMTSQDANCDEILPYHNFSLSSSNNNNNNNNNKNHQTTTTTTNPLSFNFCSQAPGQSRRLQFHVRAWRLWDDLSGFTIRFFGG